MTQAEELLIAAAELNAQAAAAERTDRPVEIPSRVVRELAFFLERCGRMTARAGGIAATKEPAAVEHAHDIARTHLGETR
jgi:hypothetical protein